MISWLKYDPAVEIKKLTIPVLLINGDKDLQIKVSEAELASKQQTGCEAGCNPKYEPHFLKR